MLAQLSRYFLEGYISTKIGDRSLQGFRVTTASYLGGNGKWPYGPAISAGSVSLFNNRYLTEARVPIEVFFSL